MSVTQILMKTGRFGLNLQERAPWGTSSAVAEGDHIVITANRLEPIHAFSDANILASSIYTGYIEDKPTPISFTGYDLSGWLETPDGRGDVLDTAVSGNAANLATWLTALLPVALTMGTVTSPATTHTATYQWIGLREAFDAICRAVGAEWRVNPNGTLDAGPIANLFVTTPTVVVTRKRENQDGIYRGLDGEILQTAKSLSQYTTRAIVAGQGEGVTMTVAAAVGTSHYKDLFNNDVVFDRLVDAPEAGAAAAAQVATAVIAQFNGVRRDLSLSSNTYVVTRFVKPGDYVYVFDQIAGLHEAANKITYQGELITPIKLRVYGLTWPIERGVGVYARRSAATPVYTDLTDYVAWETSDVTWEVGAAPLPMSEWGTA